ncbi:unnamed protein product, partial [Strongylus vulgaris]
MRMLDFFQVIYVQALILVYILFQIVRKIFFGELRASEAEHLSERAWHAVLETCLAFTVFRDDFSPIFVMQFVALLFVKSFHWLADDRICHSNGASYSCYDK